MTKITFQKNDLLELILFRNKYFNDPKLGSWINISQASNELKINRTILRRLIDLELIRTRPIHNPKKNEASFEILEQDIDFFIKNKLVFKVSQTLGIIQESIEKNTGNKTYVIQSRMKSKNGLSKIETEFLLSLQPKIFQNLKQTLELFEQQNKPKN